MVINSNKFLLIRVYMQEIDSFVTRHNNKLMNYGGTQCVAVANAFEKEVVKGAGDEWIGTPLTFYAIDWWTNFGNDSDYQEYLQRSAVSTGQKGALAIWSRYGGYGLPHIALVLEDLGGSLRCFTQNPGAAHVEILTKKGLVGYLVPKKFAGMGSAGVPSHSSGGKYSLAVKVPGFVTAADAKARRNSNSVVPVGEYFIFSKADGMVNITRVAGEPGWWINPSYNKRTVTTKKTGRYRLNRAVAGYIDSKKASTGRRELSNSTVPPGVYYVFNQTANAINITRKKGEPGWWIKK